jgi:copper ion binding protein
MMEKLSIKDMHCTSCEKVIETEVMKMPGVKLIKVSYSKETAEVEFDTSKTSSNAIIKTINELGYEAKQSNDENKSNKGKGIFSGLFGRK